jgi:thymidylate synthase (FAD)
MVRVELIHYVKDGEKLVALAAKRSITKKPVREVELSDDEVDKWIAETFRRQHWSPWEFSWYVFEIEDCSRVCTHQLVRHRIASYVQLSQRYNINILSALVEKAGKYVSLPCKKGDYMCYAMAIDKLAEELEREANPIKQSEMLDIIEEAFRIPATVKADKEVYREYVRFLLEAVKFYLVMINRGIPYEDARYILPQAVRSRIIVAMNARELVTSFLPLRMCARAQREIREVAWKMWYKLKNVHPRLFKYVGPRCVLLENTLRERPVPLEDYLENKAEIELIPRCPELVPRKNIMSCLRNAHNTTFDIRL